MTRKRYTKLLMARGLDRNTANWLAAQARCGGKSYAYAYAAGNRYQINNFPQLDISAEQFFEAVKRAATDLAAGFAAISKAFKEKMEEVSYV